MRSRELAELLLRKASQDEFALAKLGPDPACPDEVLGFHAQQAVEKMLKAVLAIRSVRYRKTHDLVELNDLIRQNGIRFPPGLEEIRRLTPFAAEFRYDDLDTEREPPFDRSWATTIVARARTWVESILGGEVG